MEDFIKLNAESNLIYLKRSDGVVECRQSGEINQSSLLTFTIDAACPKAKALYSPDLTAQCEGRVYCVCGESGINKVRSLEGVFLNVEMKETWYKLSKKFLTAYNIDVEESGEFAHIDLGMVVLYGNSPDPLNINGEYVSNPYPVGSSKYLFWCVLYGTGWTLDERYNAYWPEGVFDLESDKKSVLENIKILQEFFGGMLFWDSVNMRAALVDESKYRVFGGFEARYAHNLKGIEKRENRDVTTRLYVYGNSNLNIADVNGGLEYIDNYSYTSEILEGIAINSDIYEQPALLSWGLRQSEILSRPRYEYEIEIVEYSRHGFDLKTRPVMGELAKIIDDEVVGEPVLQRIISFDQNVWDKSDLKIKAGDVVDTFKGKFKDIENSMTTTQAIATSSNQIVNSALLNVSSGNISIDAKSITGMVLAPHIDWQGAEDMTLNIGNINAKQIAIIADGKLKAVGTKTIAGQDGLFLYVE